MPELHGQGDPVEAGDGLVVAPVGEPGAGLLPPQPLPPEEWAGVVGEPPAGAVAPVPWWRHWAGWRTLPWGAGGAALGAGVAAVGGLPPYGWWWLAVGAFAVLVWLLRHGSPRRGASLGFLFGFGHFLPGFSWLLTSLHDFGHLSWPVSYAMLVALAAAMACYPALFGWLVRRLNPPVALWGVAVPSLWVITEWLRATLFTGFPWNLTGYVWDGWSAVLQLADLGGVWLLSWLVLLLAVLLARGVIAFPDWPGMARWLVPIPLVLFLAHGYGQDRLTVLTAAQGEGPTLKVGLVQGNIAQHLKWSPEYRRKAITLYSGLTWELVERVDLVVWPETAITEFMQFYPEWVRELAHLSEGVKAPILVGTHMANPTGQSGRWDYFNSLVLLDPSGSLERRYDKHHLVPFGEYIPLRQFAPATFKKFTEGTQDFADGPGPVPLKWEKGALGCLICYEAIFPNEVRRLAEGGALWLINATNDGWFGPSAKPQHLAMTRMRAVENRLPLARVANTGISAAFDQTGRELGRVEPDVRKVLVAELPAGSGYSLYRKTGDGTWLALMVILAGGEWASRRPWRPWWEERRRRRAEGRSQRGSGRRGTPLWRRGVAWLQGVWQRLASASARGAGEAVDPSSPTPPPVPGAEGVMGGGEGFPPPAAGPVRAGGGRSGARRRKGRSRKGRREGAAAVEAAPHSAGPVDKPGSHWPLLDRDWWGC